MPRRRMTGTNTATIGNTPITTGVTTPSAASRKRGRRGRSTMGTRTGVQHLSIPRTAGASAQVLQEVGNFINFANTMHGFKPGLNVQSLYDGWLAARGLTS